MTDDQWSSKFEPHRAFLEVLAESLIEPKLRRKFDAQDIVQDTFLAALDGIDSAPPSGNPEEMLMWLITILKNKLKDLRRRYYSQKRDLKQENSVDAAIDQSILGIEAMVPAMQTSPSGAAIRKEDIARLATAIRSLDGGEREVIVERYINRRSHKEICEILEKSGKSVAGLLYRGMTKLKKLLD